jgi:hypothetical protein
MSSKLHVHVSFQNNTSWVLQLVIQMIIVFFHYNCNYKFMLMIV